MIFIKGYKESPRQGSEDLNLDGAMSKIGLALRVGGMSPVNHIDTKLSCMRKRVDSIALWVKKHEQQFEKTQRSAWRVSKEHMLGNTEAENEPRI